MRVPANESSPEFKLISEHMDVSPGLGRTASQQATFQIAALAVTLLIAIVGGLLVGMCVCVCVCVCVCSVCV